jgi:tetratricopeptide (TPR) repeat protein
MLIEAEPSLAGLLWQFARDVHLWSAQPPGERNGLFAPLALRTRRQVARGVEEYPVLRWPLRTLEAMVSAPEVARANDVALACTKLAEWADAHHMTETAIQYAEAAAIAQPRDAQLAAVAGSACARVADVARAEIWYRRAIRLGSRNRDWEWYTRGYIRLANLDALGEKSCCT